MNCFIRIKPLILLLLLCGIHTAHGQGEDYQWHFGTGHHLDFSTVPPVYTNTSNMVTWESSASISDAQGNLLFYTMGCRVWDRNGNEMPNATGLKGNGSSSPGPSWMGSGHDCVQIIPHPGNPYQYYIFSSSAYEDMLDTVFYHIVDMQLNGGLGDVIPASKNTVLLDAGNDGLKEFVTATKGDCGQFWFVLVTSAVHNSAFYAYKIDEYGLNPTPVISVPNGLGTATALIKGQVRIAPSGQFAFKATDQGILRADFNKSTGQFSNFEMVPNSGQVQYFEFSPSGQYLYTGGGYTKQYDLQLYPNLALMSASAIQIGTAGITGSRFRLAPDNKIYTIAAMSTGTNSNIYRIEQPDLPGLAANFAPFTTIPLTYTIVSLGAQTMVRPARDTIHNKDTIYMPCTGNAPVVLDATHQGIVSTYWSDGSSGNQRSVNQEGVYWADAYTTSCMVYRDSFVVLAPPPPPDLGNDTILCDGNTLHLSVRHSRYEHITWSDGSSNTDFTVSLPGTYYVTVTSGPCSFSDTVQVAYRPPATLEIQQSDTTICKGSILYLVAGTSLNSSISWNTGQTGASIPVQKAGTYQAYTENECGMQSDSVRIAEMDCDCKPIVPNAFTPNGDGRNDVFMPVFNPDCDALYYELKVYNRYGQLVFMTNRRGTGWDGTYSNGQPADAGVYFYTVKLSDRYGDTDNQLSKGDITLIR